MSPSSVAIYVDLATQSGFVVLVTTFQVFWTYFIYPMPKEQLHPVLKHLEQ